MNKDLLLKEILPYRMQTAAAILNLALQLRMKWVEPPQMSIYVDGKLAIEGNLNGFTNPAIEAGMVYCRAILEFLGLCLAKNGQLDTLKKRRRGDIGIEHFCNANGYLQKLAPADALKRYTGGRIEVENALNAVFQITNKGLAHITEDLLDHPEHGRLVEIASLGIPSLISHLYTPLGLQPPNYELAKRYLI